jgi:hypothetical protein
MLVEFEPSINNKKILEYIYNQITDLEISNYTRFQNETDYSKGMNTAFRECILILTSILNDESFLNLVDEKV